MENKCTDYFQPDISEAIKMVQLLQLCNENNIDIEKCTEEDAIHSANTDRSIFLKFIVVVLGKPMQSKVILKCLNTLQPFMLVGCLNMIDPEYKAYNPAYIFEYPYGSKCIQIKCAPAPGKTYVISMHESSMKLKDFIKHNNFNNEYALSTDFQLCIGTSDIKVSDLTDYSDEFNPDIVKIDMSEFGNVYTALCFQLLDSNFSNVFDTKAIFRGQTKTKLLALLNMQDDELNDYGRMMRDSLIQELKQNPDLVTDKRILETYLNPETLKKIETGGN